jgi:hypothetical protein
MITVLLVAAALAWLFWPRGNHSAEVGKMVAPAADLFRVPPQVTPQAPTAPPPTADADPRPAIDQILRVRDRLAGTGRLDEANAAAVDRLVLELVHGKAEAK